MVNSGSYDSDGRGDRNAKAGCTQPRGAADGAHSSSPVTASAAAPCKTGFSQTADSDLPSVAHAIEPTPTKTEFNSDMPVENFTTSIADAADGPGEDAGRDERASLCCSLPLEKVQGVLTPYHPAKASDGDKQQAVRKLLCLYCDRSFVSANLRQKHVERVHSVKQNRRVSSRRQNHLTATPCVYCDRLNGAENTLKDLFQHLVSEHSGKYFGCLPCEDRFLTSSLLADHNASRHPSTKPTKRDAVPGTPPGGDKAAVKPAFRDGSDKLDPQDEEIPVKITRSKMKPKVEESEACKKPAVNKKKSTKLKELRAKKLSVKSSRIALKRRESKRLQAIAKLTETQKKKRPKPAERKQSNSGKTEQASSTKSTEKGKSNSTCINPYPEFDHFYRVKKITDHSIDNLKISSLTFDDVFDKAFFNRIKCNIEENLLHHIDGKLFKNEESESRISNFEKVSNAPQEMQNTNSENYGCELSLNAVTPVATSLSLNSQFGEDFESQIEYGSKPSKKKTQTRKDEVHYKYFTRRKYQASILEHKENRDLSKLDMWTQLVIKKRQQKMLDDKKSAKEILEYTSCDEYKNKLRREELNRILDRRGPFEDLREEASKKAALDKLNSASEDSISQESFTEVRQVLNEILNRVFGGTEDITVEVEVLQKSESSNGSRKEDFREIPGYLNLRRSSSLPSDGEIDKSDRIALICSSQETENFELPTNQVRGKNELIELTGEWARCRMYICAACGAKLPNMRYLLEHKSLYHQNVWVQHYEFVGNQSELYRHLSIPVLGKVGAVEKSVQCKVWRRSDARVCTKCGKQCNSLGELHRHILECGGDWTWMLARKKCKYRPFGAKSRRKRRGLVHRIHHKRKTEPAEKKTYKKRFDGPRQRPSDADTIERMLANLPAKRSTRKLISLHEGIYRTRKKTQINTINQKKVKCGKMIYKTTGRKETTEQAINTAATVAKPQKNNLSTNRRSLRSLNKVLASRILDTNSKLSVKRKLKVLSDNRRTRRSQQHQESKETENNLEANITTTEKIKLKVAKKESKELAQPEAAPKRTSPRSSPQNLKKKITVKKLLTGNISIKSFFPVKKRKQKKNGVENQNTQEKSSEVENVDIKTRSKRKSKDICEGEEEKKDTVASVKTDVKKTKNDTFGNLVRSLSFHGKKTVKHSQNKSTGKIANNDTKSQDGNKNKNVPLQQETNDDKPAKKRKLKRSFRNVINKVKKLKTDTAPENTPKSEELPLKNINTRSSFLDEVTKQDVAESPAQAEKIVIPSTLEAKENIADLSTPAPIVMNFHDSNEDPPIPETMFKLESNNEKNLQAKGELNFDNQPAQNYNTASSLDNTVELTATDKKEPVLTETGTANEKTQPISIETSVKPKVVPLISPNMKGKIRKPTRGLNDCIAMLTSKLQQKTVEETATKDNIFALPSLNRSVKSSLETVPSKAECILRIPTFKTHTAYPEIEEALDLSTKSLNKPDTLDIPKVFTKTQNANPMEHILTNVNFRFQEFLKNSLEEKIQTNRIFNSVDRIIEEVVENRSQKLPPPAHNIKWNSVDETIEKVIGNECSFKPSQLSTKNTIDDIIDFVVGYKQGTCALSGNIVMEDDIVLNKIKKPSRKIGSVRKTAQKKSGSELSSGIGIPKEMSNIIKDDVRLNEIGIIKEKDDIISKILTVVSKEQYFIGLESPRFEKTIATSLSAESNPEIALTKTSSLKKNSKKLTNNETSSLPKQIIEEEINIEEIPLRVPQLNDSTQIVEKSNLNEIHNVEKLDAVNLPSNETEENIAPSTNINHDTDLKHESNLNKAFIIPPVTTVNGKTDSLGSKKAPRKVGQVRNRSRSKKKAHSVNKPTENVLETNLDNVLDVKEISACQSPQHTFTSNDTIMTKQDEIQHLLNEDEPLLLENKVMTPPQIRSTPHSDSEDDVPLSALIKSDDPTKRKEEPTVMEENISKTDKQDNLISSGALSKEAEENNLLWNMVDSEHSKLSTVTKTSNEEVEIIPTCTDADEDNLNLETLTKINSETNSKSSDNMHEPVSEAKSVNSKITNETDKVEESDKSSLGKKEHKRRSRSVKKKVSVILPPPDTLSEKVDAKPDSPDSDTPLAEIFKPKDREALPKIIDICTKEEKETESCPIEKDNSDVRNNAITNSTDSEASTIISNDLNRIKKATKNKSKSKKPKTEKKLKANDDFFLKTSDHIASAETQQRETKPFQTSTSLLVENLDCTEKMSNLTETEKQLRVPSAKELSGVKNVPERDITVTEERKSKQKKSNHDSSSSQITTDFDALLTAMITAKKCEIDFPVSENSDINATSEVHSALSTILDKSVGKSRKKKSKSNKKKIKTRVLSIVDGEKNAEIVTNESECNSRISDCSKEKTIEMTDNTVSDLIDSGLELSNINQSACDELNQDVLNDQQESEIQKVTKETGMCEEPAVEEITLEKSKPFKKKSNGKSNSLDFSQIRDNLVVNLEAFETPNVSKSVKRTSKSVKYKTIDETVTHESSGSSLSDLTNETASEEKPKDNSVETEFVEPKLMRGKKSLRRSKSRKTKTCADNSSTDSVLSDSSLSSSGLSDIGEKLLESPFFSVEKMYIKKKRSKSLNNQTTTEGINSESNESDEIEQITPKRGLRSRVSKTETSNLNEVSGEDKEDAAISSNKNVTVNKHVPLDKRDIKDSKTPNEHDMQLLDLTPITKEINTSIDGITNKSKLPRSKRSRSRSEKNENTPSYDDETVVNHNEEQVDVIEHISDSHRNVKGKKGNNRNSATLQHKISDDHIEQKLLEDTLAEPHSKIRDNLNVKLSAKHKRRTARSKSLTNALKHAKTSVPTSNLSAVDQKESDIEIVKEISADDTSITIEGIEPTINRRQPVRNCQRNKNKGNKNSSVQSDTKVVDLPDTELLDDTTASNGPENTTSHDPLDLNVSLFDLPTEKLLEPATETAIAETLNEEGDKQKANDSAEIVNGTFPESPIKIIINKQKTRRKSKSFKKTGLKGQNDLFEDFALVIKKPKRIAPIITYTSTDNFAKDVYAKNINQPIEQLPLPLLSLSPPSTPPSLPPPSIESPVPTSEAIPEDIQGMADLDASVEEMDMELDEIPIVSNIIERDTSSFASIPVTTNLFCKENLETPQEPPAIEKANENQGNKKKNKNAKMKISKDTENQQFSATVSDSSILKAFSPDKLFQPSEKDRSVDSTNAENVQGISFEDTFQYPEKDLLLRTGEKECLYENNRETPTKENMTDIFSFDVPDLPSQHKEFGSLSRNRNYLDNSLEMAQDNFDFVSKRLANDSPKEGNVVNLVSDDTVEKLVTSESNILDFVSNKEQPYSHDDLRVPNTVSEELESTLSASGEKDNSKKSKVSPTKKVEPHTNFAGSRYKRDKRKKSKCTIDEIEQQEVPNTGIPSTGLNKDKLSLSTEKDLDSIYTFTELEDLEIDKPIEIPRRTSRRQTKSTSDTIEQFNKDDVTHENLSVVLDVNTVDTAPRNFNIDDNVDDELVPKSFAKRKSKSGKDISHLTATEKEESGKEIKENNVEIELFENGRRKSIRSAKVKALEHIHDDALAELTESERNREKSVPSEDDVAIESQLTKKKTNRRHSRSQKVQKAVENTELPKESTENPEPAEDLSEKSINAESDKEKIHSSENISDALHESPKKKNKRQTKTEKASADVDLENLENTLEKEANKKPPASENINKSNKTRGSLKQSSLQKEQESLNVDELIDADNSTEISDFDKELRNHTSKTNEEHISVVENSIPVVELSKKKSSKKKTTEVLKSLTISDLLTDNVEKSTLTADLEELERTIESELNEKTLPTEESAIDSEELSKELFCKKEGQKNQKLFDNFDSSAEIAQKCAELIDFADDIVGLEELENSIERELNTELEVKKKQPKSKASSGNRNPSNKNENVKEDFLLEDNFQELRRSRRGSRKVTSYNENDLIDPLLDEIDNKKKSRKKERVEDIPDAKVIKKPKECDKKLNSDELFDLLKASTKSDTTYIPKPPNPFLNNLEEVSTKGLTDENFENVFENILEKSFLIQNSYTDKSKMEKDIDKIYEFIESPEDSEKIKDDPLPFMEVGRRNDKNRSLERNASLSKPQVDETSESASNIPTLDNTFSIPSTLDLNDSSVDSKNKSTKVDKPGVPDKPNYCEICNKSFTRLETLIKHKRTLTHIQKLSEIEAKEAAEKSKSASQSQLSKETYVEATSETSKTSDVSKNDINISDILQDSNKPNSQHSSTVHSSFANNHSLKLADIINDVLNKPVLEAETEKRNSFSDIIMQQNLDAQPEYRRYKSLGERKSFDSQPAEPQSVCSEEPYISKTTILEKQISLLENIIENQTGVNYIDDISMSSNNSMENNTRESPSELQQEDSSNMVYTTNNSTKPTSNDDSFLKPTQYEEISEDSTNVRNYEDQKLRKTLNRDEELFLECCSLLKSGSEVSSYSNKKSQGKIISNMGLKQCDEPEWLERKSLVQKPMYNITNDYSDDNSRIPTPLGDSYDDDASNSNTISSNWNMNKKAPTSEEKVTPSNKSFSFEEVLNEYVDHNKDTNCINKFGGILTKADTPNLMDGRESPVIDDYKGELSEKKQEEFSDGSTSDSKKIITKGARKVFEGLKVSIPTEELNLDEVLNCSPKQKKAEILNLSERLPDDPASPPTKPSRTARKSKPVKNKSQIGSNLLFKMNKKKLPSPTSPKKKTEEVKSHDVYDFEETQDNTDVFTKPDFRTFRNMKCNEPVPEPESDTESHDYLDSFSMGAPSITSSISSSSSKKPKAQENITKKKCMIMGRIFKNQAKSKLEDIDEEMRHIPEIDNSELVENYVADCKKVIRNEDVAKPNLTESEINQLFDQLLEARFEEQEAVVTDTKTTLKPKPEVKKVDSKKRIRPKNRKRVRSNSDSTDDEFNINKVTKKRAYRKNGKAEDNCINLEQELKECIGVASRKSQRKCTSGKQNVLVEYWSSDDSQFEALLESQRIEVKQKDKAVEEDEKPEAIEPVFQVPEVPAVVESIIEPTMSPTETSKKPQKPKSVEKKPQQKKKPQLVVGSVKATDAIPPNRRKRAAVNPLYHWSSSSEDESHDLIEVKPIRDELEDDEDRPVQHGWIVGDSPKKLVTMLAQAKGKKTEIDCVKEQGKKRTNTLS